MVTALTVAVSVGGSAHATGRAADRREPRQPRPPPRSARCAPPRHRPASLGPTTAVPANPVSKLVSPAGGVSGFTATASALYVDTGSQLVTYTLAGATVGTFALPAAFGSGDEVSQPVVDPSGNIYLSSYYGTAVAKFSPTGTLLWSVDPQGGNPTALFAVGTGASWRLDGQHRPERRLEPGPRPGDRGGDRHLPGRLGTRSTT